MFDQLCFECAYHNLQNCYFMLKVLSHVNHFKTESKRFQTLTQYFNTVILICNIPVLRILNLIPLLGRCFQIAKPLSSFTGLYIGPINVGNTQKCVNPKKLANGPALLCMSFSLRCTDNYKTLKIVWMFSHIFVC